jgi:hypothetical protein
MQGLFYSISVWEPRSSKLGEGGGACGHPTTGVPARVQRVTHNAMRPHQNRFLFTTFPVLAAVFTVTIMYTCTLKKVSTPLPLVLITSYCVGTSTDW